MWDKIIKFLKYIYYIIVTLPRDLKGIIVLSKVKTKSVDYDKNNYSVQDVFNKWLKKQPNKPMILYNDEIWTFEDIENYSNKIANLFMEKFGIKRGDCIALFMENRPEFVCIWFGFAKLGATTALINTNLRSKTLIHSITIAKPKLVIYDEELEEAIFQVRNDLNLDLIRFGSKKPKLDEKISNLESLIKNESELFSPRDKITGKDVLMYIYTSGTTGLPKPAVIKHNRYVAGGFTFFDAAGLNDNAVFYVTLPIYHSNAEIIGIGSGMISGATIVLRKKFSATNFWKDAVKYKCTAFSYVGEICRYLLNQPSSEYDKMHKIRVCFGNGTRDYISRDFLNRFGVKCCEIYGATEANCALINLEGKHGSCGFIPVINKFFTILPYFLIRIDDQMNPIRNENGFCIECEPCEKGLLVALIDKSTKGEYSGYANCEEATNKKIIRNLFKTNQNAFNTGDVLMIDWYGYAYFVDRLGDTFRWRGENVSTLEIEDAISSRLNSIEVSCYGVEIPGQEGKAGMVSIITNIDIDIKKLGEEIKTDLPSYAKPLFIRLTQSIDHTGSLKAIKAKLIQEGYNVNLFSDKTYFYDTKEQTYNILTKEVYEQIQKRLVKF